MDHESTGSADAALAQAWAAGDEGGYTALVTRYAPMIHARCRRALGAADADDATQAVCLVLARKRAQAAASPALAAWLFTVADFVIRNALRERRRRLLVDAPEELSALPAPEPAMTDIREHLDACLAKLPAAEREAVRLHHLAGHTLAEVAAHTGVPLSTVHDRVRRGQQRLKPLLERRGVQVASNAVLLACLQGEAAAAVPERLMVQLRDLAPAGGGTGPTAAPSARALRWSRPRMSTMTRFAIAGAVLLLTGGILHQSFSTEAASAEPAAVPPVSATAANGGAQPDAMPIRIDPERARLYLVARIDDAPTTLARCRQQPEVRLIPGQQATIWDQLAGVRSARGVLEPFSHLPRARQVAYARALAADGRREQSLSGTTQEDHGQPSFRLDIAYLDGQQSDAVSSLIRTWVAAQPPDLRSLLKTENDPRHIALAYDASHGDAAGIAAALAGAPGGADLDLAMVIDPGVAGAKPEACLSVAVTLGPSGAHLAWNERAVGHAMPAQSPACDRLQLERVPRQALAAAVYRLARGTTFTGLRADLAAPWPRGEANVMLTFNGLAGSLRVADPEQRTSASAAVSVLDGLDGDALIWLQPGTPFPALCAEIPMTESEARELIANRAAGDADAFTFTHKDLAIHGCWRSGRLFLTTDPAGTSAILAAGGFCDNPEVRSALAAMPDHPAPFALVMRSGACLDQALPLLNMVLPSEQRAMLSAYREAVRSEHGHGWLVGGMRVGGRSRSEAGGILALGAVGTIIALALDPGRLIGVSN